MKWLLSILLLLSLSSSSASAGILLSDEQTAELKLKLKEIKNESISLQTQLSTAQIALQNARAQLRESLKLNEELTLKYQSLQSQLQKQSTLVTELNNSLTNAYQYSKKLKRQRNNARWVCVVLLGIIIFR